MHNFRNKQLYIYLAALGAVAEFNKVCTQFQGQLYNHLAMLGVVAELNKVCTQFEENPAVPRQRMTLGTAFIGYRVRRSPYAILGKPSYCHYSNRMVGI